jgi:hypothetical protein
MSHDDIFVSNFESNVKPFAYSFVTLYFLLKEINNYEPALVERIISYIGIKNDIYYWAKFFFDSRLSRGETLIMNRIYPATLNIEYSIATIHEYFINEEKKCPYERRISNFPGYSNKEYPKYYYKNKINLIKTIWFFYIIKNNEEMKILMDLYCKLFIISKEFKRNIKKEKLTGDCYTEIDKKNVEQYKKIYKVFMKLVNEKMNNSYILRF